MAYEVKIVDQLIQLCDFTKRRKFEIPIIWLRDNCQCSECFHPETSARIIDWDNFDFDVKPVTVDQVCDVLKIVWSDGHKSSFDLLWLAERNFSTENISNFLENSYQPKKLVWGREEFEVIFQSFDYNKVLSEDSELLQWLEALAIRGVALLKNTPPNKGEIYKLADRVAFLKKTQFGDYFVVQAKKDKSTFAYTPSTLQLHTDIPYYQHMPGVNLLHCLVQSKSNGGQNLITDGFYVAEKMRREFPRLFGTLASVKVNWCDAGNEGGNPYSYQLRAPVICLDDDGKVVRINRSINNRDSFFSENVQNVLEWYEAMAKFVRLLKSEAVEFKMSESDFLTFDNTRLVHGRTGYSDSVDNSRTLVGGYVDWDHIYSKIRVLRRGQKSNK